MEPFDPMGVYLENITVDIFRMVNFFTTYSLSWNYPEAHLLNEVYINNLSGVEPHQFYQAILVANTLPANFTASNIDCRNFYTNNLAIDACLIYFFVETWIPVDSINQYSEFNGVMISHPKSPDGNGINFIGMLFYTPHYRLMHPSMNNMTLVDIVEVSNFNNFGIWGSFTEQTYLSNFYFKNVTSTTYATNFRYLAHIYCENFTFVNTSGMPHEMINFDTNLNISMKNIVVTDYETASPVSTSILTFIGLPTSVIIIEQLYVANVILNSAPFVLVTTEPLQFILKDGKYQNIWIEQELSMFDFRNLGTFSISNQTFENVNSIVSSDSSSDLININSFNTQTTTQAVISDIYITKSTVSFSKINSISGLPTVLKFMDISNIEYFSCSFPSFRALFTTLGIFGDINLELKFTNLTFKDIIFEKGGEIIHIQHLLPSPVQILASTFENITAGRIKVNTFRRNISGIKTRTLFKDWKFLLINSPINSFISTESESIVEVMTSNFSKFSSINQISGIFNSLTNSIVSISDSLFNENSAHIASLFKVESNSLLQWVNWTITNNFSLKNGIMEVNSGGKLELTNWKIYNNYAIESPIGLIFETVDNWVIDNSEIYFNEALSNETVLSEVLTQCKVLWFLESNMKTYLASTNMSSFKTSHAAIELIFGNIIIQNLTHFHDQKAILRSFLSSVTMLNSTVSNIIIEQTIIEIVSSTMIFENMLIENIMNSVNSTFILITSDSVLNATSINYLNSQSTLFNVQSSQAYISFINYTNINDGRELINIYSWSYIHISNIKLVNTSAISEFMITIDLSQNITIENIIVQSSYHSLFMIVKSEVTAIKSVQISNNKEPFKIINSKVLLVSHSIFMKNGEITKLSGGAINLYNTEIEMFNWSFTQNIAKTGGAIAFLCNSILKCQLKINQSSFMNNIGVEKGGAIYYNYNYPSVNDTYFEANTAQYGPNIGSYPVRIGLMNDTLHQNIIIRDVGSGLPIKETLTLALLDYNNQVMNLDSSSQIKILAKDFKIAKIGGINTVSTKEGMAIFNSISSISQSWTTSAEFLLSSNTIDSQKVKIVFQNNLNQQELIIKFRDWSPGEKIDGNEWKVCAAGTYSVFSNSTECTKCIANAEWLGGQQISVRSGYWRRFQNSTFISQWLNEKACQGGYNEESSHPINCEQGYTGNLWAKCLVQDGIKYQNMNGYECK